MTATINHTASRTVEADIQGKKIIFESGWLAKQANGSCIVRLGETIVFSAATVGDVRDFGRTGNDLTEIS